MRPSDTGLLGSPVRVPELVVAVLPSASGPAGASGSAVFLYPLGAPLRFPVPCPDLDEDRLGR